MLENQFTSDGFLRRYLARVMPKQVLDQITPDLVHFGHRVATDINEYGQECEKFPPKLVSQDAWGKIVNKLWTCEAWRKQHDISAQEGVVAIAYEREYQEYSRLYQMTKGYLYGPSGGLYGCPLSMTDGAAATIESLGLLDHPIYKDVYQHLTTRDASQFWTSGQWMTEKGGGSDVAAGTQTIAIPAGRDEKTNEPMFNLHGYKWFSSATDSDIAFTLARIADHDGNVVKGTRGLSLFLLKVKDEEGKLNNINMVRLKDKVGTRQLPTAELLLDGTRAFKLSEEGKGVSAISNMLQVTRFHNTIGSTAYMRRILNLARDYAHRRIAFGKPISEHALHAQTLARMDLELKGSFMLTFETIRLFGRKECNVASDEEKLVFRILNPLAKIHVCKQSLGVISEGLEAIGGQALMEDTGIPGMLRDNQIFVIWEGTTNILSLDVLRSVAKSNGETLRAFSSHVKKRLSHALVSNHEMLKHEASKVNSALDQLMQVASSVDPSVLQVGARDFAFSLARIFIASTLLESACDAQSSNHDLDVVTALRWCQSYQLSPFLTNYKLDAYNSKAIENDYKLVMENYNNPQ